MNRRLGQRRRDSVSRFRRAERAVVCATPFAAWSALTGLVTVVGGLVSAVVAQRGPGRHTDTEFEFKPAQDSSPLSWRPRHLAVKWPKWALGPAALPHSFPRQLDSPPSQPGKAVCLLHSRARQSASPLAPLRAYPPPPQVERAGSGAPAPSPLADSLRARVAAAVWDPDAEVCAVYVCVCVRARVCCFEERVSVLVKSPACVGL